MLSLLIANVHPACLPCLTIIDHHRYSLLDIMHQLATDWFNHYHTSLSMMVMLDCYRVRFGCDDVSTGASRKVSRRTSLLKLTFSSTAIGTGWYSMILRGATTYRSNRVPSMSRQALQAHYIAAAAGKATKGFLMYETCRLGFSTAAIIVLAVASRLPRRSELGGNCLQFWLNPKNVVHCLFSPLAFILFFKNQLLYRLHSIRFKVVFLYLHEIKGACL